MTARRFIAALVVLGLGLMAPPARAGDLPIFDAHMHYSHGAWDAYAPADVLKMMDAAGVSGALASSTPDDGTRKLMDTAPGRIVGGFRPYRGHVTLGSWIEDPDLLAYSRKRLVQGRRRAFGEVHLHHPDDVATAGMAGVLALVAELELIFHVHSDAQVVEALMAKAPALKVLWAHAGMQEPAAVVGRVLDRHPNVWTELSYRARDVMPGAVLDAEWRALLIRHAERFLVGTDTWEPDRWHNYGDIITGHRAYLNALPAEVAEKIAHKNAEKLFGPRP